jgi:hypothetical protein
MRKQCRTGMRRVADPGGVVLSAPVIGQDPSAERIGPLATAARAHAVVLAASWLLATAVALFAYSMAPTAIGSSVVETLRALQPAWPWYTLCYGLFFVADAAIACLGVLLMAWLAPLGGYRALAMVILFALAGALGLVMDVGMLVAAQLFRSGALLRGPPAGEIFLGVLNAATAWLSAATFLLSGCASSLVAPLAARAGAARSWIGLTRVLAAWQIAVSAVIAWSAISAAPLAAWLSLGMGVVATPLLASLWLAGLVREVRRTTTRSSAARRGTA